MRKNVLILISISYCFFISNFSIYANQYEGINYSDDEIITDELINDTLRQTQDDFSKTSSTITLQDTIKLNEPDGKHGSIFKISGTSFRNINKKDLAYKEYHGFSEMLEEFVPVYTLNLGSPGLFNSFSFFGTNPNNVSFSFNGRPLFDAEYSSLNPEQLCTEFFESVEILTGSDAVILGDNSSGALLNIQEIKYNTRVPYTKLWYSQGGNGYLSADGIFSQNFAPNFNFTFGFRRQTGQGRYENSWVDAWNVRGLIRWTPDEKTSISLVEYFTNHGIGLNGGIDRTQSINDDGNTELFDNNYATPFYADFNQRVFRHDLTFSITRQLSDDTSSVVSGNLYVSNSNWELENIPFYKMDMTDTTMVGNYLSRYYGTNIAFEQRILKNIFLKSGADAYMVDLEKSFYHKALNVTSLAGYALAKIELFDFLSVSGGLRIRNYNGKTIISEGVKLKLNLNENHNLFFDFSVSERMPSSIDWFYLENEKNTLILSEYSFSYQDTKAKLGATFRIVNTPIEYYCDNILFLSRNGSERNIFNSYLSIEQRLFRNLVLNALVLINNQIEGNYPKMYPLFAKLSLYYEIVAGRSILRLGASGKYVSSFNGETFLPQYRGYMTYDTESEMMFDGLKVFASAKLGNAYVKASFENILGSGFYTVPIYPYYGRNFRVSFSWSFLD